jgi:hypothetical protein
MLVQDDFVEDSEVPPQGSLLQTKWDAEKKIFRKQFCANSQLYIFCFGGNQ